MSAITPGIKSTLPRPLDFYGGQSLLVTTPMNRAKSILVREGQTFTARMMVGSGIIGFTAATPRYAHIPPPPPICIRLPAAIRNVHEVPPGTDDGNTQYQYGIEFSDLDDRTRLMLIGFVF